MEIDGELVEGRFLSRDNRFRVTVAVDGQPLWAHLPNSGRLGELLLPGRRVLLAGRHAAGRKTAYDMVMAKAGSGWVSVDARLPNDLVAEALAAGRLDALAGYAEVRREVAWGHSRFDFRLDSAGRRPCLVEVKSVTLVVDGWGCFPDAVTARGRRHVLELAAAVQAGYRAAVVFVVQRQDVQAFRPHDESDPAFGQALRRAVQQGVEVYACACQVQPGKIAIDRPLPANLHP
ncbi:MAG: DNA/RNA nuclease SfsA [Anaerolineae bacterium]